MKVYLAGPIHKCSPTEAWAWRKSTIYKLSQWGIEGISPPEGTDAKSAVESDMKAIDECDVVLANCWKPSPGTSMEIFYASYVKHKPVFILVTDLNDVNWWTGHFATDIFDSLDSLLRRIKDMSSERRFT